MALLSRSLLVPLTRRYQTALLAIADQTVPVLKAAWTSLPSHDEDDVARFSRLVGPSLAAAKQSSVATSVGYLRLLIGGNAGLDPDVVDAVFDSREPFIATWKALSVGTPHDVAVDAGFRRAEAASRFYVQSSARRTGDHYARASGRRVSSWIRIPNGGACDWCQSVAPGHYKTSESADFGHKNCGCTAAPSVD